MEEARGNNYVFLKGTMGEKPVFSHGTRGEDFFRFALDVERLSGAVDRINILARDKLLEALDVAEAPAGAGLCVEGELRSFNNRGGTGARLVITVFARSVGLEPGPDENRIILAGTLCKPPVHRVTPMGREICDLMLAVNRRYGRSDYLPCIAWGQAARMAADWDVGTAARLTGRVQSRKYIKTVDGFPVEKTAYEVSAITLERMC